MYKYKSIYCIKSTKNKVESSHNHETNSQVPAPVLLSKLPQPPFLASIGPQLANHPLSTIQIHLILWNKHRPLQIAIGDEQISYVYSGSGIGATSDMRFSAGIRPAARLMATSKGVIASSLGTVRKSLKGQAPSRREFRLECGCSVVVGAGVSGSDSGTVSEPAPSL